jgi:DNA-binding NtrC family response regulator
MKKSILIVDDDEFICQSTARALSNSYMIFTASNGQEAMDVLTTNKDIELILTDIFMPEMDGIELLKNIRSSSNNIAVIMMTGHSNIEMLYEAKRHGADDFLPKPVDLDRLELSIKKALLNPTNKGDISAFPKKEQL